MNVSSSQAHMHNLQEPYINVKTRTYETKYAPEPAPVKNTIPCSFKPGYDSRRNLKGRPRLSEKERAVRDFARTKSFELVNLLTDIAADTRNSAYLRYEAAKVLWRTAWGQKRKITGMSDTAAIVHYCKILELQSFGLSAEQADRLLMTRDEDREIWSEGIKEQKRLKRAAQQERWNREYPDLIGL